MNNMQGLLYDTISPKYLLQEVCLENIKSQSLTGWSSDDDCDTCRPRLLFNIPHICHFFYTDRIFENQILHPKKRLKAPKTLKMSLKKSNICIFFTQSGKIYTWQKFFTQTCLWCLWQIWGMHQIAKYSWFFHFRIIFNTAMTFSLKIGA